MLNIGIFGTIRTGYAHVCAIGHGRQIYLFFSLPISRQTHISLSPRQHARSGFRADSRPDGPERLSRYGPPTKPKVKVGGRDRPEIACAWREGRVRSLRPGRGRAAPSGSRRMRCQEASPPCRASRKFDGNRRPRARRRRAGRGGPRCRVAIISKSGGH